MTIRPMGAHEQTDGSNPARQPLPTQIPHDRATAIRRANQRLTGAAESLAILPGLVSLGLITNCGGAENIHYPDSLRGAMVPVATFCGGVVIDGFRRVLKNT